MKIALFQQYYIPSNSKRKQEIIFCLKCNLKNKCIHTIFLLNETQYSLEELGMNSPEWKSLCQKKVQQIVVGSRLTYHTAFSQFHSKPSFDYYILSNSDIFFDSTLQCLPKYLNPHTRKSICLGRHEYRDRCKLLHRCPVSKSTRTGYSQDAWIFHHQSLPRIHASSLSFHLGKPGCDNRIAKLLHDMNLTPINPYRMIRSYHYHTSGYRTYQSKDKISGPILSVPLSR